MSDPQMPILRMRSRTSWSPMAGFGTSVNSIFPGLVMVARSISTLPDPQNFGCALV
jgi:hypothetical protein